MILINKICQCVSKKCKQVHFITPCLDWELLLESLELAQLFIIWDELQLTSKTQLKKVRTPFRDLAPGIYQTLVAGLSSGTLLSTPSPFPECQIQCPAPFPTISPLSSSSPFQILPSGSQSLFGSSSTLKTKSNTPAPHQGTLSVLVVAWIKVCKSIKSVSKLQN